MQDAMNKIISGFKPDISDIEKYAEAIYHVSSNKLIETSFFKYNFENYGSPKAMEHTADCFKNAFDNFYE